MKISKFIPIIVIVVFINNALLLAALSYFSSELAISQTAFKTTHMTTQKKSPSFEKVHNKVAPAPSLPQKGSKISRMTEAEVISIVKSYMESAAFTESLTKIQAGQTKQNIKFSHYIKGMAPLELYNVAIGSSSDSEKEIAVSQLLESGGQGLEAYELKELYQSLDDDHWGKTEIVTKLLEDSDPESMGMARELLSTGTNIGHEFYPALYDADPEYVKQYIDQLEVDNITDSHSLYFFMHQEPELYNRFINNNFDSILNASNDRIFEMNTNYAPVDISYDQQAKLVDLFESNSQAKRNFAISMANNINDDHLLRDAFPKLTRARDQRNFLGALSFEENNLEKRLLIEELEKQIR